MNTVFYLESILQICATNNLLTGCLTYSERTKQHFMNHVKKLMGLSLGIIAMLSSCDEPKVKESESDQATETYATTSTTNTPCLADASWFDVDPTTGQRKTKAPDEGKSSAFGDNETVSNCDFHRWSWQKFLWLTNDVSGNPLFLDSLFQVNSQTIPVSSPNNRIMLDSSDNLQATGNILKSNKSYNSNNINYDVYYSIHVDSSLYNTIWTYAHKPKSDYADSTFPVGALELKIAWVDANALRDTNDYFLTDGNIEGEDTRIALLGMHVTGIVYNHPEFVWATFEHSDLAPYYDWAATTTTDVPVTTTTNYPLFDSTATGTLANITLNSDSTNVFAVNKYGVPRQAQNTFLLTSQSEPENYDNIDSINNSVHSQLTGVWNNYFYNGSIWINTEGYSYPTQQAQMLVSLGATVGNADTGKLVRGSTAAYNITMETYEQLGFAPTSIHGQNVNSLGNCFSCHTANSGSALNFSHIFNGAVDSKSNLTPKQTKQKHLDEIKTFIQNMKAN